MGNRSLRVGMSCCLMAMATMALTPTVHAAWVETWDFEEPWNPDEEENYLFRRDASGYGGGWISASPSGRTFMDSEVFDSRNVAAIPSVSSQNATAIVQLVLEGEESDHASPQNAFRQDFEYRMSRQYLPYVEAVLYLDAATSPEIELGVWTVQAEPGRSFTDPSDDTSRAFLRFDPGRNRMIFVSGADGGTIQGVFGDDDGAPAGWTTLRIQLNEEGHVQMLVNGDLQFTSNLQYEILTSGWKGGVEIRSQDVISDKTIYLDSFTIGSSIPEPAGVGLLFVGGMWLMLHRRRGLPIVQS